MKNFRLQILLERTPLSEHDKHNIRVIFEALSHERQQYILDHWQEYITKIIEARYQIDEENKKIILEALDKIDTYLDEARIKQAESERHKNMNKEQTRQELHSTVAYGQLQKLKKIKEVAYNQ